jgi:50S ribosomal protein L16 3-hydroxylase
LAPEKIGHRFKSNAISLIAGDTEILPSRILTENYDTPYYFYDGKKTMKKSIPLLGGLTVDEFLRDYWQKKPLLIRQAIPGFNGLLDPKKMIELACDEDAQARIVTQNKGTFGLQSAPFSPTDFKRVGKNNLWTVLLQGLNHYLPEGTELLKQFNFIPHARLDDLMVSYAPKGGGVGPHFDPYDVFLLQGMGHRRWQISTQADRTLVEGAPLRILKEFHIEQEWVLAPGDMLYLPPQCGHNGIAEDDCMTYSIGFRTPAYQEMAEQFLVYLQDRICVEGLYADPKLKTQTHPSEISAEMLKQVSGAIKKIRWDKEDVANFLGSYLSEPKPHIFFEAPGKTPTPATFEKMLTERGVKLDLKTQMLCYDATSTVFINGESFVVSKRDYRSLRELADTRALPINTKLSNKAVALLAEFYQDGWITFGV